MRRTVTSIAVLSLACNGSPAEPFQENLDIAVCHQSAGPFSATLTNPYFPMTVGSRWTLEGGNTRLEITALNETEVVAGVTTRVVEERETQGGTLIEVSRNFFVQTQDGTVCYFGEDVDDIEDDVVVDHGGRWCAEDTPDVNKGGIFMPADPKPGMTFLQEDAPGIALDGAKIVGSGPVTVPFDRFTETIRFREFSLIEGKGDYKVFGTDFGPLVDGPLELTDFTENAVDPGDPISEQVCGSP